MERKEETQGGNRVIEFTYKLTIENFGKAPAAVRLLDRLPSPKGSEIKLTMLNQQPPLSEDKDYLETDRKKNLLRWDIVAAPAQQGPGADGRVQVQAGVRQADDADGRPVRER